MAISGTQGPMALSPGRMSPVTKDIQVRYLYGMGLMALVTKYIKIVLSGIREIFGSINKDMIISRYVDTLNEPVRDQGTPSPFWRIGKGKCGEDPTKKSDQNFKFKNDSILIDHNNSLDNTGTIRGEDTGGCWVGSFAVSSPWFLFTLSNAS
jgi:hypothetical protein